MLKLVLSNGLIWVCTTALYCGTDFPKRPKGTFPLPLENVIAASDNYVKQKEVVYIFTWTE